MMRPATPSHGSDNVGDVLASIRRLIAQDEAGAKIPDRLLNSLPGLAGAGPAKAAGPTAGEPLPLRLDGSKLVAPGTGHENDSDKPSQEAAAAPGPVADEAADQRPPSRDPSPGAGSDIDPADRPRPRALIEYSVETQPVDRSADAARHREREDDRPADLATSDAEDSDSDTMHNEETMLQTNTPVTPINPAVEAALQMDDTQAGGAEPHLFSRSDKDSQKGTHLRGMIRDAIRQELQGEVGNRLSRNLQQMIRHEIEQTLRQMCEED
ncbi:hypothetical protein IT41_03815 [Paracoccus halophilus]|nr:hypothetical protein IT41_03815 [Paracoccus halophilus]